MGLLAAACLLVVAEEPTPRLVRKDLLVLPGPEIAPPIRNIFRPRTSAAPAVRRGPAPSPATPGVAAVTPSRPEPAFTLAISYIGAIKSGGRTIALVLVAGRTLSVGEGDEIAPGYRVVRLTPEELVIEGPNAERRTFTRQGERP